MLRLVQPFLSAMRERSGRLAEPLRQLEGRGSDEQVALREVLRWLDEDGLGLSALHFVQEDTCDVIACLAASARDLGEALETVARYAPILCDAAAYALHVREGRALFELRSRTPLNRPAAELQAGLLVAAARSWLGELVQLELWFAQGAPIDDQPYRRAFAGCDLRFGAPCDALVFDAALLRVPLRAANSSLHAVLRRYADQLLPPTHELPKLVARVQELVLELLKDGKSDICSVAARLGMSRRTLARHLRREGATYRDFVEDARCRLAHQHLALSSYDVKEIAYLLGYSETAAFSRAFRRWSGQSPIAYRRTLRAGSASRPAREHLELAPRRSAPALRSGACSPGSGAG